MKLAILHQSIKKLLLIQPLENYSKVIDIKGGSGANVHVPSYQFILEGLYKVPADAPATAAPNFDLPASTNDFTAGNFKVEKLTEKKTTAETFVKFKVTYLGQGMGIVDAKKIGIKIESGQVFANWQKPEGFLLSRGESETISAWFKIEGRIVDMQFANMQLVWGETFKEAQIIKIDGGTYDLVVDPGLTAGKNK